jgi:putative acetyltransferase
VYYDEATDRLSEVFSLPRSTYYIAEQNGTMLGGAGIYPTEGLPASTCEIVKMYLLPEARGIGLGRLLMNHCIDFAISNHYTQLYLETMPELSQAIGLYETVGFKRLNAPVGATGHYGCDIWMAKPL